MKQTSGAGNSKTQKRRKGDAAVQGDLQERIRLLDVELRRVKEILSSREMASAVTANKFEDRLSKLEGMFRDVSDEVKNASRNAAYAVSLINGDQPGSGPLSSPLGPMSESGAVPVDNRNLRKRR